MNAPWYHYVFIFYFQLKTQDSELDDTRDKLQQLQQEVMNSKASQQNA